MIEEASQTIINVHTQSDNTTYKYALFMWETMLKLANKPERLMLTVQCIGQAAVERFSSVKNCNAILVPNSPGGSVGHGLCIDQSLAMIHDRNIHVICDADAVVLARGWDDYVRTRLMINGLGIVGTTMEDIGGFSSGTSLVQTAKRLPTVIWCAMSPNVRWQGFSAGTAKTDPLKIETELQSIVYNLPIGYSVMCDVGWQLPQFLFDNQIKFEAWKQLKPTKTATVLRGLVDYHEEFHVENDVPFIAHQRGSRQFAFKQHPTSVNFFNAVEKQISAVIQLPPMWEL
jgi:hypothetical protein